MLLHEDQIYKFLRCPKSGVELVKFNSEKLVSNNKQQINYKIINGYPILIDYENSILNEDQIGTLNSIVNRKKYNGLFSKLKKIVTPANKISRKNILHFKNLLFNKVEKRKILIIGGSTIGQGIQTLYDDSNIEIMAFDIYASEFVQFIADAHNIPIESSLFDGVIIQAVLEHVLEPQKVVSEIYRVLKKDGYVYAETPFLQHVHEGAYDFTRFTESGQRFLFKDFMNISSGACASAGTQLLWSLDYFFRGIFRSERVGKIVKLLFFWLQYLDFIIPDSYNIDAASCVYFLGQKQKNPMNSKEIVTHYKGNQK